MLKIITAAVAGLLLISSGLLAGRAVIDDVRITEEFGCSTIRVKFNFPVRYINHFPHGAGDDLRVQLEPIITHPADREALVSREEPLVPPDALDSLQEVVYEGNVDGGPYLTLFFDHPVRFEVEQGSDFRSLLISVTEPGTEGPCRPTQ